MKKIPKDFRFVLTIAALAFGLILLISPFFIPLLLKSKEVDSHQWLHQQLDLTLEQDKQLVPIEDKFTKRKTAFETEIMDANRELAEAIKADGHYSARVKQAVDKIHHAQGELQKATLEHLFEMHAVLKPEQKEKLNKLTTDALINNQ